MSNPISSIPNGNGNSPVDEFGNCIAPFFCVAVSYAGYGDITDGDSVPTIKTLDFPANFFQQSFSCPDSGIHVPVFVVQQKPFRIGKEPVSFPVAFMTAWAVCVIQFELAAPVIEPDERPGTAAHGMIAACRRMTAAENAIAKAIRIVESAVDADCGNFFSLIH